MQIFLFVCSIKIIFLSGFSCFHHQEDFFYTLHDILANMEEVSELQPIPDAHVPVMKFKFDGISIDLLYASISRLIVPEVRQTILFCTNFANVYFSRSSSVSFDFLLFLNFVFY